MRVVPFLALALSAFIWKQCAAAGEVYAAGFSYLPFVQKSDGSFFPNFILATDKADHPEEPDTYRLGNYRSTVPKTLSGAGVLDSTQAIDLWKDKKSTAVFIDVLPLPPKPQNLPEGTVWRQKKRFNIPNSYWLPNVGFGMLNPDIEEYFEISLVRLTMGDKNVPLVFYCLADCWMSWNAAKRALEWGYTRVHWFPDGTDGWVAAGGQTERNKPYVLVPPEPNH